MISLRPRLMPTDTTHKRIKWQGKLRHRGERKQKANVKVIMEGKNSERERMYNKLILRKERESMCCGKEAKTKGIVFTKSSSFFFSDSLHKKTWYSASVWIWPKTVSERQRDKETEAGQESHHVEIGADFDSSGQVPHNAIPIMPRWEKDSWVKGVWLQNKHFVLMALSLNNTNMYIKTMIGMRRKKGRRKSTVLVWGVSHFLWVRWSAEVSESVDERNKQTLYYVLWLCPCLLGYYQISHVLKCITEELRVPVTIILIKKIKG